MPGDIDNPVPGLYMHKRKATYAELEADTTFLDGQVGFVLPDQAYGKLDGAIFRLANDPDNIVFKDGLNAPFNAMIGVCSDDTLLKTDFYPSFYGMQYGLTSHIGEEEVSSNLRIGQNVYPSATGPKRIFSDRTVSELLLGIFGLKLSMWKAGLDPATEPPTNAVNLTANGVDITGTMALGYELDADWVNTEPALFQHRLGKVSTIQTLAGSILYDAWGSGFRSELILGSDKEAAFANETPTNVVGRAIVMAGIHVVGIGGNTTGTYSEASRFIPDTNVVDSPYITDATRGASAAVSIGSTIVVVDSKDQFPGAPVGKLIRSTNNGGTWSTVYTVAYTSLLGGITRLIDGTLITSIWDTLEAVTPLYSTDDGATWAEGTTIPEGDIGGIMTYGQIHNVYIKTVAGTYFFITPGQTVFEYARIWTAPSLTDPWTLVGPLTPDGASERVSCSCYYAPTDSMYIGIRRGGSPVTSKIFKLTNNGTTIAEIRTRTGTSSFSTEVIKILVTPDGVLYTMARSGTGIYNTIVERSLDGGTTWTTIVTYTVLIRDMIYSSLYRSIYIIKDGDGGVDGFAVDVVALEKNIATHENPSQPMRARMNNGAFEVSTAKELVTVGDAVNFGAPELHVSPQHVGMLLAESSAISPNEAESGYFFRNTLDNNELYIKRLDGTTSKV